MLPLHVLYLTPDGRIPYPEYGRILMGRRHVGNRYYEEKVHKRGDARMAKQMHTRKSRQYSRRIIEEELSTDRCSTTKPGTVCRDGCTHTGLM